MATTENTITSNTTVGPHSFTFPYMKADDVKVTKTVADGTVTTLTKVASSPGATEYTQATTSITLGAALLATDKLRIYRETSDSNLTATFYPGSAIRSADLNDNFTQNLYTTQEVVSRYLDTGGLGTMSGDLNLGKDVDITFEGATANAHEITLTVTDPTADRTITLPNETGTVVTTASTNVIDSDHYVDGSIDRVHLEADIIDGTKIADDVINSEHYAAGSIDLEHMSANSVDSDQYVDGSIDGVHIANDAVDSQHYAAGSIDLEHMSANSIDSDQYVDGSIDSAHIANDQVDSQHYAAGSIDLEHMSANSVDSDQYVDGSIDLAHMSANSVDSDQYVDGSIDNEHIAAGQITSDKLNAATVVTAAEQSSATANDTSFFTTSASDARYFNVSTGETIKDGDTFPDNDTTIATTAAINDRIIDIVDDVGGFVPLVNEAAIPAAHPEANNAVTADRTGTIISIGTLSATYTPSGGTCTIPSGTLTNHSVNATITDCGSTTLSSGFGVLVETTAQTDAQYAAGPTFKFHRLTPKATEVTTVAGISGNITTVAGIQANVTTVAGNTTNINTVASNNTNVTNVGSKISDVETVADNITDVSNFADLYQIATSAPGTDGGGNALADGDLWFDSSSNKAMKVYNGSAFAAVTPVQSVLDDIAIVSGNLTRQEDLGSIADAISSGTGTGSLDTCATNITNINTFANVYRIASSAPSSSLDEGDLWYDSTNNVLKIYNGTAWVVTASAGLGNIVEDASPELGGHLDCNDKNLTEVATVSGNNLQIDFGTL